MGMTEETTLAVIDGEAEEKAAEAREIMARYENYAVTCQADYERAVDEIRLIKCKARELDDLRKSMTRPLDDAKKRIIDFFRPPMEALSSAENRVKGATVAYQQEEARRDREREERLREAQRKEAERLAKLQREAEERARIAAEEGNAAKAAADARKAEDFAARQAIAESAPVKLAPTVQKVAGARTVKNWKFAIEDAAAIPREYMIPDEVKIGKVVRATAGSLAIPGVRIYCEETLAVGR